MNTLTFENEVDVKKNGKTVYFGKDISGYLVKSAQILERSKKYLIIEVDDKEKVAEEIKKAAGIYENQYKPPGIQYLQEL